MPLTNADKHGFPGRALKNNEARSSPSSSSSSTPPPPNSKSTRRVWKVRLPSLLPRAPVQNGTELWRGGAFHFDVVPPRSVGENEKKASAPRSICRTAVNACGFRHCRGGNGQRRHPNVGSGGWGGSTCSPAPSSFQRSSLSSRDALSNKNHGDRPQGSREGGKEGRCFHIH